MILEAFGRRRRSSGKEDEEEEQTARMSVIGADGKRESRVHDRKAAPLHPNLQDSKQACKARKAIKLLAACNVLTTCG